MKIRVDDGVFRMKRFLQGIDIVRFSPTVEMALFEIMTDGRWYRPSTLIRIAGMIIR